MGNVRIDMANIVTISLVSFIAVFAINRALEMAGKGAYKA